MNSNLPYGWSLKRLSDVTERIPNVNLAQYGERRFGYVDISSIDNRRFLIRGVKHIQGRTAPSRARRPIRPGDVLFSNVRTYLRNIALVPEGTDASICSTGFTVLRPKADLSSRFLFHYVLSDMFLERVTPRQTGTHYPATSDRRIMAEVIPVPPIKEQELIAQFLDRATTARDGFRQHVERAHAFLRQFRMSVLAAACSGRLTEDWHVSDASGSDAGLPQGWHFAPLGSLSKSIEYGTSKRSDKTGAIPVLRMGNIQSGSIDWSKLAYTSDQNEIKHYALHPGAVLFNRTNSPELVGKSAIYRGKRPAIFAGYLIRINVGKELDPEYLNICLNSPHGRDFCRRVKTDGVSQSNINAKTLATFEIPLCSLDEQRAIVERAARLLEMADSTVEHIEAAESTASQLMPALLRRAFSGGLNLCANNTAQMP